LIDPLNIQDIQNALRASLTNPEQWQQWYKNGLINEWAKDLERSFRDKKHIKFKAGRPLTMKNEQILFEQEELEINFLQCCEITVKSRPLNQIIGIYCPCCGVR
jgi:hypothetical protein